MRARKYNKKIELWQTSKVSDGFGGNTTTTVLLYSLWCKISTLDRVDRSTNFGITDTNGLFIIRLRKREDFTFTSKGLYFIYRGQNYTIQNEPINIDFEDREIQMTIKRDD